MQAYPNHSIAFVAAFALAAIFGIDNSLGQDNDNGAALSQSVAVEGQPLASNIRRLLNSLTALGTDLPGDPSEKLSEAIEDAIEDQDASPLQQLIDPHCFAIVTLSPEERVSVQPGLLRQVSLQQSGYTPHLIKVINHSTSTARLNITSPQAGLVYAGTTPLSMQRQQQLPLLQNQNINGAKDRFLSIDTYDRPPMRNHLSGLQVEYMIVLLASTDSGKREAVLHFDIGDGTEDLEHRGEIPVLFDVQPALPVKLSIQESDGTATIARLEIQDKNGNVYPLQPKRLSPDFFFQAHIYREDGEVVWLPPGEYSVRYSRGPEYHVKSDSLQVDHNIDNQWTMQLDRWYDAADHGFFSGDHHIHAAGCAHYSSPTEGVTPEAMFRQVRGEGLNVGCVLTWGPCFDFQRQYFRKNASDFGTRDTLLKYDLEISGFGSQALGHVCLLNLNDQTYPESDGTKLKGWPTWTTPVMRWAKEQGGYAGYAHSASGLQIDPISASQRIIARYDQDKNHYLSREELKAALLPEPLGRLDTDRDGRISSDELILSHRRAADQLPNLAVPEMNGVGAMEICVSTVAGVCDFISAMDTRRIQEWNTWYHLLNCGFPLKVSGETDFPCMSSRRVGQGRVYVGLDNDTPLSFPAWCQGMADGRSYVSDGYAHLTTMELDEKQLGDGEVQIAKAGNVRLKVGVAFAPEVPESVAHGNRHADAGRQVVGDTVLLHGPRSEKYISGGEREVEIIVNGTAIDSRMVTADGNVHELTFDLPIERSSWVAVRHFPQLHSNPINVIVGERPIRASADSARWCVEMTELVWKNREKNIAENERAEAKQTFEHAIGVLNQIASEALREASK